jgi:UDP-N-acetylglucosamine 4-epimerase
MTAWTDLSAALAREPRVWLVTGAAGFIGSHLVETLLGLGQRVRGLDDLSTGSEENLADVRRAVGEEAWGRFAFARGDVRDLVACRRASAGADVVLHEAALGSVPRSIEDPLATHAVNVDGFVNVLVAARDAGCARLVWASSSSVYGDHPGLPKREEDLGAPLSPYAASKRIDEVWAETFWRVYGLEVVGLRYFNVFGPRQDPEGPYAAVIPRWIQALLRGETPRVHGDGETSRDFCPVANVVQANLLAAFAPAAAAGRAINVALGERTTLNELFRTIRDGLAGLGVDCAGVEPVHDEFRAGDVRHSLADVGLARELLRYRPEVGVAAGLRSTMEWYLRADACAGPRT